MRFQPKAWADEEYCEAHARKEMAEATQEARRNGQESVVFYDNLHGQTTDEHERVLREKAHAVRHLLPTGVTGEIQLIDDGVGFSTKNEMGHALDLWLEQGDNMKKWTGDPQSGGMAMWEKRALITHLLAAAWEKVCSKFDFERAATRLGMRMTADGSLDDQIQIQGVPNYSFCDADAGADAPGAAGPGDGSDPQEQQELDEVLATEEDELDDDACGEEDDTVDDDGAVYDSSDDSDDDTRLIVDNVGPAPTDAPSGFTYVSQCPPLQSDEDLRKLVGKYILHAFDQSGICGWFIGKVVARGVSARDLRTTQSANFVVMYERRLTNNPNLVGRVASTLTPDRYGGKEWWIMLEHVN